MKIINQENRVPPLLVHHGNRPLDPLPHRLHLLIHVRPQPLRGVLPLEARRVDEHPVQRLELLRRQVRDGAELLEAVEVAPDELGALAALPGAFLALFLRPVRGLDPTDGAVVE